MRFTNIGTASMFHYFQLFRHRYNFYDEISEKGHTSVPKSEEIESGQMVLEKVKWIYFGVYRSQTM